MIVKKHTVVLSSKEECDLDDIKENTLSLFKNEESTLEFIKGLLIFIDTLAFFPNRFPINKTSNKADVTRRRTSIQHYNIYYKVDDKE